MPAQPYHHPDLRTALVAASRVIVEEEGAEACTIARVARVCGVSVAAPYRHFASRRDLLGAVAGEGFVALREALEAAPADEDPAERLVSGGQAYVDFALAHPRLFELMFRAELRDRQSGVGPAALAALSALIAPLDLRVPHDVAVRAAWASAHGQAVLRIGGMLTLTREDSAARLREDLSVLVHGIAAGPRP